MEYNIRLLTEQEIASTQGAESFDIFEPNELEIFFINSFETEEDGETLKWVRVNTKITKTNTDESGKFQNRTERISHHVFPFSVWENAVSGIDLDSGQPTLDKTVLNQICASFGIKII